MENEIEELILETLRKTANLVDPKSTLAKYDGKLNIIFPEYRNKEKRYSEQELKQIFINTLDNEFLYSVETPSRYTYRFADQIPKVHFGDKNSDTKYQSSMIDVSLYDEKQQLKSHIEFKHGQCNKFQIKKDFLKLICESEFVEKNYFVHYFETSDNGTKKSVIDKYKKSLKDIDKENTNVIDLNSKLKKIVVFVMFVGQLDEIYKFSLEQLEHSENVEKYKLEIN